MTNRDKSISSETLEALRGQVRGEVLGPDDPGYDDARALWNGMIDSYPDVIVRCRGAADVIAAVSVAREAGLPLSIKAGGHTVAGKAVCDDGIVIDLSPMNNVRMDPQRRRASVGAGALWEDFDHEAQAFGLTSTGGGISARVSPDSPSAAASAT